MKNLLNCHSIGLHSFPISFENGLYKRVFYAAASHNLWRLDEIAIHPHHVDIEIRVLDGVLTNPVYSINPDGYPYTTYKWNSVIKNGAGGFERVGVERLALERTDVLLPGSVLKMKACELHTVFVERGECCAWLITEQAPSCEYTALTYSRKELENWTADGLYEECSEDMKQLFIGQYLPII